MQLNTIKKSEQGNVIGVYWIMMRELEELARDGSALDKHMVESYYSLWNRMTGDDKEPIWVTLARKQQEAQS